MKIFSAAQIREWDLFTIKNEPISSTELMERAALKSVDELIKKIIPHQSVKIFCAKGNNGGDGLAIARLLELKGIATSIYILEFGSAGTPEFQENLHKLHDHTKEIHFIQDETFLPTLESGDLIIDAIYGSGLNRPLEGLSQILVEHINKSDAKVIAIDIPSGMFADKSSIGCTVIYADNTLTFQALKLCFLLPEYEKFIGRTTVLNIGLHPEFLLSASSIYELIDLEMISSIYRQRKIFSHKGTYGHALIIAGSKGKMGAAILAAKSCLRTGAGLVTTLLPEVGIPIMQTSLPEAMAVSTDEINTINFESFATIGIGPGLGNSADTTELLVNVLNNYNKPMVIDADALNIIADQKEALSFLPPGSILTPHPKEYERIFGRSKNDFDRLKTSLKMAKKLHCFIVIKGHFSFVACPTGKGYFNSTGNAGMATAGSGDVLTGIISGLLSQGYSSLQSALLGVFLHGKAGDIAAEKLSPESMIASDITENLGNAFRFVSQ